MSLQTQTVPVIFFGGLDSKTDPKLVVQGKLLEVDNAIYQKTGQITKRNGYIALSSSLVNGGSIISASGLGIYNETQLLQFANQNLYSYLPNFGNWQYKGFVPNTVASSVSILRNGYQQTNPDMSTNNGIELHTWEDGRGGVYGMLVDATSNTAIVSDTQLNAGANAPQCVSYGIWQYVTYLTGSTLLIRQLSGSSFGSEVNVSNTVSGTAYSLINSQNGVAVAYNTGASTKLATFSNTLGIVNTATVTESGNWSVSLHPTTNGNLVLSYANPTQGVRAAIFSPTLNLLSNSTTLDSTTSASVLHLTGIASNQTSSLWWTRSGSNAANSFIQSNTVTDSGSAGIVQAFIRSVALDSTPQLISGSFYIAALHQSYLQATSLLFNASGNLVATLDDDNAGNIRTVAFPAHLTPTIRWSGIIQTALATQTSSLFTLTGVNRREVDFPQANQYNEQIGQNVEIGGGIISNYDGKTVTEEGFTFYPEFISASVNVSSSAGLTGPATYSYSATYEWMDNAGQIHISAPSVALQVFIPSPTASVTFTIETARVTQKQGMNIHLYRTPGNTAGTYYKVTPTINPIYNSTVVDAVTYTDTLIDTQITGNELLYTVGGALANYAPPGSSILRVWQNRLWIAQGNALYYSNISQPNQSLVFNNASVIYLDPIGGDITGLARLNTYLVIFKRDRAYVVYGIGPDATGQNGSFYTPQQVAMDVGCINNQSIALLPDGIIFQSAKGIYKLNSSLMPTYIGAAVEEFNDATITAATLIPDANQVRFLTSDDNTLVYNYYFTDQTGVGLWSTFSNHQGEDATILVLPNDTSVYVYLNATDNVYVETPDYYLDNNGLIVMTIQTGWLSFAGLQNFQRIRRLLLLGEYESEHQLNVLLEYNFAAGVQEYIIFNADGLLDNDVYGSEPVYGFATPYGGGDSVYQFRIIPMIQKCEAIRLTISDLISSSTPGSLQGFSFNGLTAEVGVKKGPFKVSPAKTV